MDPSRFTRSSSETGCEFYQRGGNDYDKHTREYLGQSYVPLKNLENASVAEKTDHSIKHLLHCFTERKDDPGSICQATDYISTASESYSLAIPLSAHAKYLQDIEEIAKGDPEMAGRFIKSFWRNRSDVLGVRIDFVGKFKQLRAELDTDVFAESARGSHYSEARELQMNPSNGSDRNMAVHRLLQQKHLLADTDPTPDSRMFRDRAAAARVPCDSIGAV
jgi:hypothetical protein